MIGAAVDVAEKPPVILCRACQDYGFTGADSAKVKPAGVIASKAFSRGVACSCAAGREFAEFQMEWMR